MRVYRCANEARAYGPLFLVSPDGRQHVQVEGRDAFHNGGDGFGAYLYRNWSSDASMLLLPDGRVLSPGGKLSVAPKGAHEAAWYRPTLDAWLR